MAEISVAYQGEPGAYSEEAVLGYFGEQVTAWPCHTFDDVFAAVSGEGMQHCTHGLVPIENSQAGSIHRNYDLMVRHNLWITGEYHLPVHHCLLALPGVTLAELSAAHSHPQALAQCEASLARLGLKPQAEADTAGSARLLRDQGRRDWAAIASRRAAEVYGLQVLLENIEDSPENTTRFLVLAPQALADFNPQAGEFKTTIVFSLHNQPGVLFKALSVFALRDIDLTKIESRPLPGHTWEYLFYVDFVGHAQEMHCKHALDNLQEFATYLRVLGSYRRHRPA